MLSCLRVAVALMGLFCIAWPFVSCRSVEAEPQAFAYLVHGEGVHVVQQGHSWVWPGSATLDTYAWCMGGEAMLGTLEERLVRVDAEGGHEILLEGQGSLRFPDWRAQDGAVLVAARTDVEGAQQWRMLLVTPDSETAEELGSGYDPCFQADGNGVFFEDFDAQGASIFHLDLGTGERQRLAKGHTVTRSNDGRSIYFSSGGHLMRLPVNGASVEPEQITEKGEYDRFVSTSRDGRQLVFFRQLAGKDSLQQLDLSTGVESLRFAGRAVLPTFYSGHKRAAPIQPALAPK